jgi:hypothetical protein
MFLRRGRIIGILASIHVSLFYAPSAYRYASCDLLSLSVLMLMQWAPLVDSERPLPVARKRKPGRLDMTEEEAALLLSTVDDLAARMRRIGELVERPARALGRRPKKKLRRLPYREHTLASEPLQRLIADGVGYAEIARRIMGELDSLGIEHPESHGIEFWLRRRWPRK